MKEEELEKDSVRIGERMEGKSDGNSSKHGNTSMGRNCE
jgi:hypothetical protein